MNPSDLTGLKLEYRDFVAVIDGQPVVVERVPYHVDLETNEAYLHASVAERLDELLRNRPAPSRQVLSNVYEWPGLEKAS